VAPRRPSPVVRQLGSGTCLFVRMRVDEVCVLMVGSFLQITCVWLTTLVVRLRLRRGRSAIECTK
jgi:hypothetical protein